MLTARTSNLIVDVMTEYSKTSFVILFHRVLSFVWSFDWLVQESPIELLTLPTLVNRLDKSIVEDFAFSTEHSAALVLTRLKQVEARNG